MKIIENVLTLRLCSVTPMNKMDESREIKKEETSEKILNAVMSVALSERVDMRVSKWDILSNVVSIILRLTSVLLNMNLAYEYYEKEDVLFFRVTLCFIFAPALISMMLSIVMWVRSLKNASPLITIELNRHHEDSKKRNDKNRRGFCSLLFSVVIFPYTLR